MSRIPIIKFREMEQALFHLGFELSRQKGGHIFYRHPDGRTTTLPCHPRRDLSRPLLYEILREIKLTPEEFIKELRRKKS